MATHADHNETLISQSWHALLPVCGYDLWLEKWLRV